MALINGTSGNDNLFGTAFDDSIFGGAGNDSIFAGNGNDTIDGGQGNDTIDAGDGNDTIDGGQGNDKITAGSGNDVITGGEGNDEIDGGTGNDTISGGDGNDKIMAGDGDDNVEGGVGNDEIDGGAGIDTVSGGEGNDKILGGAGADILMGGTGNDEIDGGADNDTIDGGADNDKLKGGAGDDNITGGSGNDEIEGGTGNDMITGDAGNDKIKGDDGNDNITAGSGNDEVEGGAGNDTILADAGDDKVKGNAGNDNIQGGAGQDEIEGGEGDDTIAGDAGQDKLKGDSGNDHITGGGGNDEIDGGSGTDTARYEGTRSQYTLSFSGGKGTVRDNRPGSPEGTDKVENVEFLEFADGTYNVNTGVFTSEPTVSISDGTPNPQTEGAAATITFVVSLSAPASQNTVVTYSTVNGSAMAGSDFTGVTNGTVIIPAGATSANIVIAVLDDAVFETPEAFTVVLSAAVSAISNNPLVITDNSGTGNIVDDDPAPDTVAPTVDVNIVDDHELNEADNSSQVTFTFSEQPVGFTAADITATGGTVTGLMVTGNPLVYTATFTADNNFDGTGSVTVAAGSYTDAASNPGAGDSDTVEIDTANLTAAPIQVNVYDTSDNFVASYGTIQSAINDASTLNGYSVVVGAGTYNESVNINKELTVISSDGPGATTINGTAMGQFAFAVSINANNVQLGDGTQGFTINSNGNEGATVFVNADFATIEGNTINGDATPAYGTQALLTAGGVNDVLIQGNTFGGTADQMIYVNGQASLGNPSQVDIIGNTFGGSVDDTLVSTEAQNSEISGNIFSGNADFYGLFQFYASNDVHDNDFSTGTFGLSGFPYQNVDLWAAGDFDANSNPTAHNIFLFEDFEADKNSTLIGNALDNVLRAREGSDSITGLGGNDTFLFRTFELTNTVLDTDTVTDYQQGDDKIDLEGNAVDSFIETPGEVILTIAGDFDIIRVQGVSQFADITFV